MKYIFPLMRITTLGLLFLSLLLLAITSDAADVSPSRTVVPENIRNPPGKRYSIFSGDPERVQKANEVNTNKFQASVKLTPESIHLSQDAGEVVATFVIHNTDTKSYTLSFPDSQRYDLALVTMDNKLIYLWSSDKLFVQSTGMSFLNGDEKLTFKETLPLNLLKQKCSPGKYKIAMILSNYPELKAAAILTLQR